MKLTKKEQIKLIQIEEWEKKYIDKKENSILNKTVKVINKPLGKIKNFTDDSILYINTSESIKKAVEKAIVGCMDASQEIAKFTYDKNKSIKKFGGKGVNNLDDLYKIEVTELEKLSRNVIFENKIVGFLEGFAFGLGEIKMAIADIPVFLTLTFRVMQQIASIYGYDPEDPKEKLYMIKLMSFGTAVETSGKLRIQAELQALRVGIKRYTFKAMQEMGGRYSLVITARKIAENFGVRLTKKTLLKGIPALGGGFGAIFNYGFIKEMGDICNMMYQKRFLEDKLQRESNDNGVIDVKYKDIDETS